jgi:hypothetical protein
MECSQYLYGEVSSWKVVWANRKDEQGGGSQSTQQAVEGNAFPPMKMEPIQCSETSAYKIQTPGNYPEDNIIYPQHGESLKTTKSVSTNTSSFT